MENKKNISTRDQLLHLVKDVTSSIVGSAACVYSGQPFDTIKGFCSAFVLCPCDVVKCRTQVRNMAVSVTASHSVTAVLKDILRQVGWLASIAPDSIKSRIQASEQRVGIVETAQSIYRARGLRGFFVGLEVAIVRAFPANAALFVGYELTKELFESTLLGPQEGSSKI
eukprot:gene34844-45082_t